MKVEVKTTGLADEPVYVLQCEDGTTYRSRDLVRIRRIVKRWSEKEYQPRTMRQALAHLGAEIELLRPSNDPTKEQARNAERVARVINKLVRKGKLRCE